MFLMLILIALFHGEKTANIAAFQALLILLSAVEAPIKSAYQIYLINAKGAPWKKYIHECIRGDSLITKR